MSKRNLILLIIFLIIASTVILILLSSYGSFGTTKSGTDTPDTNFVSQFFPFGKTSKVTQENAEPTADVSSDTTPVDNTQNLNNKLIRISSLPIAGYGIYMKERFKEIPVVSTDTTALATQSTQTVVKKGTKTKPTQPPTEFVPSIRYAEKATGNIYQTFADKIDERKFSNIIVPEVYDAYFGNNGESVVMRYLKEDARTIETIVGALPKEKLGEDVSLSDNIKTSFLPENISDLSISHDSSKLFYLFNTNDAAVGVMANAGGDKKSQIFSSSFTEWLTLFPNNKLVTLNTKPSANVPGYMYLLNTETKSLNKVLSNINGLTTLTSPDGKLVLYSGGDLSLNIKDLAKRSVVSTGARTLPEKCVWNSTSTTLYCAVPKYTEGVDYPDSWYTGETSFNDEIWKIDTISGNATFITDPSQLKEGEDTDGIKLAVDDSENYLFFINKSDSSLWELILK